MASIPLSTAKVLRPTHTALPRWWRQHKTNSTRDDDPATVYSVGNNKSFGEAYYRSGTILRYGWLHWNTPLQSGIQVMAQAGFTLRQVAGANVASLAYDYTATCRMMETDWDPTTLTWNTQPTLDGEQVQHAGSGDLTFSAPRFVGQQSFDVNFLLRSPNLTYGIAFLLASTLDSDWALEATYDTADSWAAIVY